MPSPSPPQSNFRVVRMRCRGHRGGGGSLMHLPHASRGPAPLGAGQRTMAQTRIAHTKATQRSTWRTSPGPGPAWGHCTVHRRRTRESEAGPHHTIRALRRRMRCTSPPPPSRAPRVHRTSSLFRIQRAPSQTCPHIPAAHVRGLRCACPGATTRGGNRQATLQRQPGPVAVQTPMRPAGNATVRTLTSLHRRRQQGYPSCSVSKGGSMVGSDRLNAPAIDNSSH